MVRSYLYGPPGVRRHCAPVSGVLATFGTGPLVQSSGPAIVLTFSVDSAAAMSAGASDVLAFSVAFATSNSACEKPIGWVHCCLVALSNWLLTCFVVWPVSELVNGWLGDHQHSVDRLCPRSPSALTAAGNSSALATLAILGL